MTPPELYATDELRLYAMPSAIGLVKQRLLEDPGRCPVCGEIWEGDSFDREDADVYQDQACPACLTEWRVRYTLVAVTDLDVSEWARELLLEELKKVG